jgi:hypothetical protein
MQSLACMAMLSSRISKPCLSNPEPLQTLDEPLQTLHRTDLHG